MTTYLDDLFDLADLDTAVRDGYVRVQKHPKLPLAVFNYSEKTAFERCWTPVTKQCRGLIANTETWEVLARPFPKCHNWDEPEAPKFGPDEPVTVTDKLDGSLGISYPIPGGHAIATRGSFTSDQAVHATQVWNDRYAATVRVPPGVTVLFEIVFPANRIVVDYSGLDDLVLLGGIHIGSGEFITPGCLAQAMFWSGPIVETFPYRTFAEMAAAEPRSGKEGFVIRSESTGASVKWKYPEYVDLHKIVTGLNARVVWEHIGNGGSVQSLCESLPDEFHDWVAEVESELSAARLALTMYVEGGHERIVASLPEGFTRKDYALVAVKHPQAGYLFRLLDGRDVSDMAWKEVRPEASWTPSGRVFGERTTLHLGDALAVLRTLPDNSIHAIVTDPPYGLAEHKPKTIEAALTAWLSGDREHVPDGRGFMGRAWDGFVPPPAVWDECLRVLKPGGHMLVFAGSRTVDLMGLSIRLAGFEVRDSITWLYSQGFPKGKAQLKPASEPILVARKRGPLWLNIDGCRVHAADAQAGRKRHGGGSAHSDSMMGPLNPNVRPESPAGRWPANVALDEHAAAELDAQSGVLTSGKAGKSGHIRNKPDRDEGIYGGGKGLWTEAGPAGALFGDAGGASRFFGTVRHSAEDYLTCPQPGESSTRDASTSAKFPTFRYQAKAPARERPKIDGKGWPTVKPLELMRWLVRLVTPPGGTVLDPFAGTGTTGQAAELEGFSSVLIERDPLAVRLTRVRFGETDSEGGAA